MPHSTTPHLSLRLHQGLDSSTLVSYSIICLLLGAEACMHKNCVRPFCWLSSAAPGARSSSPVMLYFYPSKKTKLLVFYMPAFKHCRLVSKLMWYFQRYRVLKQKLGSEGHSVKNPCVLPKQTKVITNLFKETRNYNRCGCEARQINQIVYAIESFIRLQASLPRKNTMIVLKELPVATETRRNRQPAFRAACVIL